MSRNALETALERTDRPSLKDVEESKDKAMEGGYPWTIDPTPIPDLEHLDLDLLQEAVQEAVQEAASSLPPDQAKGFLQDHDFEAMLRAETKAAQLARDRMQKEMEDQLDEQEWESRFTRTLLPYVIYTNPDFLT